MTHLPHFEHHKNFPLKKVTRRFPGPSGRAGDLKIIAATINRHPFSKKEYIPNENGHEYTVSNIGERPLRRVTTFTES